MFKIGQEVIFCNTNSAYKKYYNQKVKIFEIVKSLIYPYNGIVLSGKGKGEKTILADYEIREITFQDRIIEAQERKLK